MIEAANISKGYSGEVVISNFNITIEKGAFISITGESGKGKSTLLNMLSLLEKPDLGEIFVDGDKNLTKKKIMLLQRKKFGYLFQNYALIENETVMNNLKIALNYQEGGHKIAKMEESLHFVNLNKHILKKRIYQLSGGEQQRVAMARLFLKKSEYIFADEPTGNLDLKNRNIIFELLTKINRTGKAVVFVTHDLELAHKSDKLIVLQ